MSSILSTIKLQLFKLDSLCVKCRKRMHTLPHGKLKVQKKDSGFYYTVITNNSAKYVGRENNEVRAIKERNFYERYLSLLEKDISVLTRCYDSYNDIDPAKLESIFSNAYQGIPDSCYKSLGFIPPSERTQSTNINNMYEDHLIHSSLLGIKMRSKSEISIASLYKTLGYEVIYEKKLLLPDGDELYPDFSIVVDEGTKEIYHEHIGMLNDPEYRKRFYRKLDKYLRNGFVPFRDVFFTFDEPDGSIDMESISQIVKFFLS